MIADTGFPKRLAEANQRALAHRPFLSESYAFAPVSMHDEEFHALRRENPYFGLVEARVQGVGPFVMLSHNDDRVAQCYFFYGRDAFETLSLRAWSRLAAGTAPSSAAEFMIDVGAFTGVYSLVASHANPEARIHALEPVERTYWRLADNLRANRLARKIEPHRLAASDEGGQAEIHVFRGPGVLDAGASLVSKESGVVRTQLVQTIRLDTFVRDNDILRVDLIKIDVERHELAVIEGMAELVSRHKPAILVEVFSREELVEIIGMLPGYRFAVINERAQKAYVGDEAAHETAGQNVLFAPWSLERLRTFFDAIAPL